MHKEQIKHVLRAVSYRLYGNNDGIDLYIGGGAAIVLEGEALPMAAGAFRELTSDIDCYVGEENMLPLKHASRGSGNWLDFFSIRHVPAGEALYYNNFAKAMRAYAREPEKHFHSFALDGLDDGLRISVLNGEPQLAMKLLRDLPGPKDFGDAYYLCQRLGVNSSEALWNVWRAHHPPDPEFAGQNQRRDIETFWIGLDLHAQVEGWPDVRFATAAARKEGRARPVTAPDTQP